jgi:hypothetical protein
MKNRLKKLMMIGGAFLLLASCNEDFLDTQPKGRASSDVMSSSKGVEALLVAAYDPLNGTGSRRPGWDMFVGSIMSDNCTWGGEFADRLIEVYALHPNEQYPVIRKWQAKYDGVARANDALRFLSINQAGEDKDKITTERALEIEAEAKFLRAHYHFGLQRAYWQIPYVKTSEEMDGMDPTEVPNDKPAWDDIENDFQFAIDNLPEDPPLNEVGRTTKWAAMTAKAHAHMEQNELDQAKPLLDAIIASGRFALVDKYTDNYKSDTEHNEESIFELEATIGPSDGDNALWEPVMISFQKGPLAAGWGQFQPTINLFNAFQTDSNGLPILNIEDRDSLAHDNGLESGEKFIPTDHPIDPRVDHTITRRGIPYKDYGLIMTGKDWIREQDNGGPFMTKKLLGSESEAKDSDGRRNPRNFRFYRYAHVLLWRAEIHVEDGELAKAMQLVNQIRIRAKNDVVMGKCNTYIFDGREIDVDWDEPAANYVIEPYPNSHEVFTSQEMAREAVRHELRVEFATEGYRFFNLRRWGIDDEVINNFIQDDLTHRGRIRFQGITYDPDRDDYIPLPQPQLDIQPVLQQDPDWN